MLPMTQVEKERLYERISKQVHVDDKQHAYVFWKLEEIRMMIENKRFDDAEKEISNIDDELHKMSDANSNVDIKGTFWYVKGKFLRCKQCKEYTKAIDCFNKSLYFSNIIKDVPGSARALNALGNTYFDRKDIDEALSYHQEAYDLLQRFIPSDLHPDLSLYEFNIGTTYLEIASKELSIYKCVTVNARENLEKSLQIFEKSMAKDEKLKIHRMPNYGVKLLQKANAMFYLTDEYSKQEEAIHCMKESLNIKLLPFTKSDKCRTLAFFRTGEIFYTWRKLVRRSSCKRYFFIRQKKIF